MLKQTFLGFLETYYIQYFPNSLLLIIFSIILEIFQIIFSIINFTQYLNNADFSNGQNNNNFIKYLENVDINTQLKKYLRTCDQFYQLPNSTYINEYIYQKNDVYCIYKDKAIIFVFIFFSFLILTMIVIFGLNSNKNILPIDKIVKNDNEFNKKRNIFLVSFTYFFDLIFHIFGFFFNDLLVNLLMDTFNFSIVPKNMDARFFLFFISAILFVFFNLSYIFYINNFYTYINYNPNANIPYDSMFSKKYDFVIFFLKIIIIFENNLKNLGILNKFLLNVFSIITFLIIFLFVCYIFFEILENKQIYFINKTLNKIRIFFIYFLNFIFISDFIMNIDFTINLITFFNILFIFCFSILISLITDNLNEKNISCNGNIFFHLSFFIEEQIRNAQIKEKVNNKENLVNYSKYLNLNLKLNEFINNHNSSCFDSECELFKIEDMSVKSYLNLCYIELNKPSTFHKCTNENADLKSIIMILLLNEISSNDQEKLIKLLFLSKNIKFIRNESKINSLINIIILQIMKNINKNLLNFQIISIYTNIFEDYLSSVNIVESSCNFLSSNDYDEIFKISKKFKTIQDEIKKKYGLINKFRCEYQESYSFYFIKFLFKKIFGQKLIVENEIVIPSEYKLQLETIFKTDNFLVLGLEKDKFLIRKATNLYSNLRGKVFDAIFPDKFKDFFLNNFSDLLKNSQGLQFKTKLIFKIDQIEYNSDLCYAIDKIVEKKYDFKLVEIQAKIFPSFSLDELYIVLKCEIIKESILIIEKDKIRNISNILAYSTELEEFICFPKNLINIFKEINIELNNIFSKLLKKSDKSDLEEEGETFFYIDYKNYESIFNKFTKLSREKELIEETKLSQIMKNFAKQKSKEKFLKTLFYVNKHEEFSSEKSILEVFLVKKIELKNHKSIQTKKMDESISQRFKGTIIENFEDFQFDTNSLTATSSFKTSGSRPNKFKINLREKQLNDNQKENNNKIKKFIGLLLSIIIFLIIFGIIILSLTIKTINEIKSLFTLNNNFNRLVSSYYDCMMNLHQNILTYKQGTIDTDYNNGYDFFSRYYEKGVKMNINVFLNKETIKKVNNIKSTIQEVRNIFFNVGNQNIIEEFFHKKIKNFYITNYGDYLSVTEKEVGFFEALDIFLSTGKIIAENPNVLTYIYYIDSSKDFFDFKNFFIKNLDVYQVSSINLIVNFDSIVPKMENYIILLNEFFYQRINFMFLLIFCTFVFLLLIHLLIALIIYFILKYFKKIIHSNFLIVDQVLGQDGISGILNKMNIIKKLSYLYSENPIILVKSLKKFKKQKEEILVEQNKKSINKLKIKSSDKLKTDETKLHFQRVIQIKRINFLIQKSKTFESFKNFTILLFIFYFIYSGISIFLFNHFHNENIKQNIFAQNNWNLSQKIVKNGVRLNTILLLNQTDHFITNTFSNTDFLEYSFEVELSKYYDEINKITTLIKENSQVGYLKKFYFDYIDCENIYMNFNDELIRSIETDLLDYDIKRGLSLICKDFPSTNQKDVFKIYEEMNYVIRFIYHQLNDGEKTYDKIREIYFGDPIFGLFIAILFILRPIRVYIENNLLNVLIQTTIQNYIIFIIFYLVVNFVIDFFHFYMIKRKIINRILEIDNNLKNLMKSLMI